MLNYKNLIMRRFLRLQSAGLPGKVQKTKNDNTGINNIMEINEF